MVAVDAFSTHVQEMLNEAAGRCRTAKLWVQYIKLVGLLKVFKVSTRTGNFVLQLAYIVEMIPVFNAASSASSANGHTEAGVA